MPRYYVAIAFTKAGVGTVQYNGNSRSAAKTAATTPVTAGTQSTGTLYSNVFFGRQVAAKNPAGT